jgi:hypothetical protein
MLCQADSFQNAPKDITLETETADFRGQDSLDQDLLKGLHELTEGVPGLRLCAA